MDGFRWKVFDTLEWQKGVCPILLAKFSGSCTKLPTRPPRTAHIVTASIFAISQNILYPSPPYLQDHKIFHTNPQNLILCLHGTISQNILYMASETETLISRIETSDKTEIVRQRSLKGAWSWIQRYLVSMPKYFSCISKFLFKEE